MAQIYDGAGFGSSVPSAQGETAPAGQIISLANEFRARTIQGNSAGARIDCIMVTMRDGTAQTSPVAAGLYELFVAITDTPLQGKVLAATAAQIREIGGTIAFNATCSTIGLTKLDFPNGLAVPPNKYANIVVMIPYTAAGAVIPVIVELSVIGVQGTDAGASFYTLR